MLSIVIPCYNEVESIPEIFRRLSGISLKNVEVVFVDNGSVDNTGKVLKKEILLLNSTAIRTVIVEKNIGYGNGIMQGIRECNGDIIAWTHADLQTDIKDVFAAYDLFLMQNNLENTFLKGKRIKRKPIELFCSKGMG